MKTLTATSIKNLKKLIQSECNFTGKQIVEINGISLENRSDLPSLEVSNRYCAIKTYMPFSGHKTTFLGAPFTVVID
jgi:hypothetical protein